MKLVITPRMFHNVDMLGSCAYKIIIHIQSIHVGVFARRSACEEAQPSTVGSQLPRASNLSLKAPKSLRFFLLGEGQERQFVGLQLRDRQVPGALKLHANDPAEDAPGDGDVDLRCIVGQVDGVAGGSLSLLQGLQPASVPRRVCLCLVGRDGGGGATCMKAVNCGVCFCFEMVVHISAMKATFQRHERPAQAPEFPVERRSRGCGCIQNRADFTPYVALHTPCSLNRVKG